MNMKQLTVIGGGQMGRALVGGMLAGNVVSADAVVLVEPSLSSQAWWQQQHPQVTVGVELATAVKDADMILLAVKPNIVPSVTQQSADFWSGKLVVSIAAGISLQNLCDWIGHQRVVRVMPNTPSLVGAGASAFAARTTSRMLICNKSKRCWAASVWPYRSKSPSWMP